MEMPEKCTQQQISQCLYSVLKPCDTAANRLQALRDFLYTIIYLGPLGELFTEPDRGEAPGRDPCLLLSTALWERDGEFAGSPGQQE